MNVFKNISVLLSKTVFFLLRKNKGNNVKKESKFYLINFVDPPMIFLKENFNTTCNENAYSDIL